MLFIHLKIGFRSAAEFVYVYVLRLETVDGDVSFRMLWEWGLLSLCFKFRERDLEPCGYACGCVCGELLRASPCPHCSLRDLDEVLAAPSSHQILF